MQGWWFVPLIAIVVAVLASVFRGAEEAKRRANQRERGSGDPRRERPQSEASGIDQFLEEIRRRQAARQGSSPSSQVETQRPRESPPAPPPVVRIEPPPRRRERPVVAVPVDAPNIPTLVLAEIPITPPAPLPPPPPPAAGVVPKREAAATTAVRAQLAAMLKSKTGLQAALIMREIFEGPLYRRRQKSMPFRPGA